MNIKVTAFTERKVFFKATEPINVLTDVDKYVKYSLNQTRDSGDMEPTQIMYMLPLTFHSDPYLNL